VLIQSFGDKSFRLPVDDLVNIRKIARIKPDAVFDQQNHLNPLLNILVDVHLILDQLDDGKKNIGIPKPAEHIIDGAEVFSLSLMFTSREKGVRTTMGIFGNFF
jgi:hypothetical protein